MEYYREIEIYRRIYIIEMNPFIVFYYSKYLKNNKPINPALMMTFNHYHNRQNMEHDLC